MIRDWLWIIPLTAVAVLAFSGFGVLLAVGLNWLAG